MVKAAAISLCSKLVAGMKHVTSSLEDGFMSKTRNATSELAFIILSKMYCFVCMIHFVISQLTKCFKEEINNLYNYSSLMGGYLPIA